MRENVGFRAYIDRESHLIYVFAVGKWRPIRSYIPKKSEPSMKIQKDILRSVWWNMGKSFDLDTAYLIWRKEE